MRRCYGVTARRARTSRLAGRRRRCREEAESSPDAWAEAQKRFHLSDLHIQMARELGLNPKTFGGLANHRQEPWKLPLPEFIAECYRKRFHRERPAQVIPLAEVAQRQQQSGRDTARHARAHTDA